MFQKRFLRRSPATNGRGPRRLRSHSMPGLRVDGALSAAPPATAPASSSANTFSAKASGPCASAASSRRGARCTRVFVGCRRSVRPPPPAASCAAVPRRGASPRDPGPGPRHRSSFEGEARRSSGRRRRRRHRAGRSMPVQQARRRAGRFTPAQRARRRAGRFTPAQRCAFRSTPHVVKPPATRGPAFPAAPERCPDTVRAACSFPALGLARARGPRIATVGAQEASRSAARARL